MSTEHTALDRDDASSTRSRKAGDVAAPRRQAHPTAGLLVQLQRSAGNQAVNRLLRRYAIQRAAPAPGTSAPEPARGNLLQRALMREPSDSDTDPGPAVSTTPDGAGGAGAGGTLRANKIVSDGALEIDAAQVTINAATTQTSGTMQASTVIADSVVAQSYTPGAGNVW